MDRKVLISDRHEFIFVQMRKVASTSMQTILRPLCIPRPDGRIAHLKSRARLEWDYHKYVFRTHEDILAAKQRMGAEKFAHYFKFAFVRNPWERLVSEYEYILRHPEHGRYARVRSLKNLHEFIRMQIPRRDAYQINMLCDKKGRLLVDFVGKLENLQNDWQTACALACIPYQPLPHRNVTQHENYRDFFDQDNARLVARHWAREIKEFEYEY